MNEMISQFNGPVSIQSRIQTLERGQTNGWHTHYNKKLTRKQSLKYKGNKPIQEIIHVDRDIQGYKQLHNHGANI